MTTPVIITLIICGTLIVLSAINAVNDAIKRKDAAKKIRSILNENNENK